MFHRKAYTNYHYDNPTSTWLRSPDIITVAFDLVNALAHGPSPVEVAAAAPNVT